MNNIYMQLAALYGESTECRCGHRQIGSFNSCHTMMTDIRKGLIKGFKTELPDNCSAYVSQQTERKQSKDNGSEKTYAFPREHIEH